MKNKVFILIGFVLLIIGFVMGVAYMKFAYRPNNSTDIGKSNISRDNSENVVEDDFEEDIEEDVEDNEVSKSEWEAYPKNIDEIILEDYSYEDTLEQVSDRLSYSLMKKTLYSLTKNYKELVDDNSFKTVSIEELLGYGDSAEIVEMTCNYPRYCYPDGEDNDLKAKYQDIIEYDIADFNEGYYDGYYDLETCVKNQYSKLEENGYDVESFYYEIPRILIMNGNNENEQRFLNYARAKEILVTVNDDEEYTFELEDTNKVQVFDLGYRQDNIKKPVNIKVEVLESYAGEKFSDVCISDFQCDIKSNIPQGR